MRKIILASLVFLFTGCVEPDQKRYKVISHEGVTFEHLKKEFGGSATGFIDQNGKKIVFKGNHYYKEE